MDFVSNQEPQIKEMLKTIEFLPIPKIIYKEGRYHTVWEEASSIGHIATFYGNFGIYLRAFLYTKLHGNKGLRRIAELSVLNANYLKKCLENVFTIPFSRPCMHEFVVQADNYLEKGIKALDIAKRLLDYGIHAPTIYFPLIIKECMLIEPTESESKATLDNFVEVLKKIVDEIQTNPKTLQEAPFKTPVSRLDEAKAVRKPIFKHES